MDALSVISLAWGMFTKFSQVSWHEPQSSRKGSYTFSSHTYPVYPQAHRSINASHPVLSILDISNSSISTGDSDPLQCPSLFIHLLKSQRWRWLLLPSPKRSQQPQLSQHKARNSELHLVSYMGGRVPSPHLLSTTCIRGKPDWRWRSQDLIQDTLALDEVLYSAVLRALPVTFLTRISSIPALLSLPRDWLHNVNM